MDMEAKKLLEKFKNNEFDELLIDVYDDIQLLEYQNHRYQNAIQQYIELFGNNDVEIYSGAGRSEIGGNILIINMVVY